MEIRGSVAVVTGASAGIGWATAVALAREGATVVVSARRAERLDQLGDLLHLLVDGRVVGLLDVLAVLLAQDRLVQLGRVGIEAQVEPAAVALAVASLIVLALRPQRAELRTIRSAVIVAALTGATIAACYLPYGVFTEWFYLRFLLPAFPMAAVCAGALAATAFPRIPQWLRGTAFVLTLAAVAAWNVTVAAREQAFNLARYEARYRVAGRYLASALPDNAVVVTVQHSGSVAHYTGLPIARWDLLADDLDAALAAMRALGRRPVLLIEEWEASQLRERFPRSLAAQLDWPPLAEFGTNVRVRVYDPADRGKIEGIGRLDRLR